MHDVVGWKCAVCATHVDLRTPAPWRCPRATLTDRHHVLHAVTASTGGRVLDGRQVDDQHVDAGVADSSHPFVRHDRRLAWAAAAAANGMTRAARDALVDELDAAVRRVDGVGFVTTPFTRCDHLSELLGFGDDAGVWVKDETAAVGGSQKARHLFSILLHLRASELLATMGDRPRLAIASCGNAALAAATLARAADWPIDVYVPMWMSDAFGARLDELGATIHRCRRRDGDPAGDPAMLRFREAVESGAIPFTVQGPENALCLDGGRTIGWEIAEHLDAGGVDAGRLDALDAAFVQVGGGAFAACLGRGLLDAGHRVPLIAVQAEGCAPLARAWHLGADATTDWSSAMRPWENPMSAADGILDDETYDWIAVLDAVRESAGDVVVASEAHVLRAHGIALDAGFDVSVTGAAGLAGLLARLDDPAGESLRRGRVAVVMSGRNR